MLAWHACHFDRGLAARIRALCHVDEHALEEVEVVNLAKGLRGTFAGQVLFCVWGRDDGKGASEGLFDFLVKVVAVEDDSGLQGQ